MKPASLLAMSTFVLALTSPAGAQVMDAGQSRESSNVKPFYTTGAQLGWAGYLGLGAGHTSDSSSINAEGDPFSVKGIASYVTPETTGVFDIGYGIQNQTFTRSGAMDSSVSAAVVELAARYQTEGRWQMGAVYNQFFNHGENYGSKQADTGFIGAQFLREFGYGRICSEGPELAP